MKTIIDAVNELRGDLANMTTMSNTVSIVYSKDIGFSHYWEVDAEGLNGTWQLVCTIAEFNAMVAEMSEGFEEYRRGYNSKKSDTATYGGKVYDFNTLYETQDGVKVVLDNVTDRVGLKVSRLSDESNFWIEQELFETEIILGTITPAPVELVNGEWYMCECGIMSSRVNKPLLNIGKDNWSVNSCRVRSNLINVKPLYKMIQEVK